MRNTTKLLARACAPAVGLVTLAPASVALGQAAGATYDPMRLVYGVVATVVYGVIGIALVALGYKVFSWLLPFDVKKELEEDHNLSVGVLLAALVLGICIVVAATILSD